MSCPSWNIWTGGHRCIHGKKTYVENQGQRWRQDSSLHSMCAGPASRRCHGGSSSQLWKRLWRSPRWSWFMLCIQIIPYPEISLWVSVKRDSCVDNISWTLCLCGLWYSEFSGIGVQQVLGKGGGEGISCSWILLLPSHLQLGHLSVTLLIKKIRDSSCFRHLQPGWGLSSYGWGKIWNYKI